MRGTNTLYDWWLGERTIQIISHGEVVRLYPHTEEIYRRKLFSSLKDGNEIVVLFSPIERQTGAEINVTFCRPKLFSVSPPISTFFREPSLLLNKVFKSRIKISQRISSIDTGV